MSEELDTGFFADWLRAAATAIDREAAHLTELDSPIGDADHGSNLQRGFTAVQTALAKEPQETPGALLRFTGRQLISTVGGASGPLYGTLLRRTGKALGDAAAVPLPEFAVALRGAADAVAQLGGAAAGDATMLDALYPALDALDAGSAPGDAFPAAARAAAEGAEATVPLQARKGRASYLGERSVGHEDPGAASTALLFGALAAAYGEGA